MNKKLETLTYNEIKTQMDILSKDILDMYNGGLIHRFNRYVGGIRVDECIESILNQYDLVKARNVITLKQIKDIVYEFINQELISYGEITPGNEIKVD